MQNKKVKYLPGPLTETRVRMRTSNSPGFESALNSMMRPAIKVARNINFLNVKAVA